jgi:hypothetical protein
MLNPVYFAGRPSRTFPVLPFVLASLPQVKSTLVIGPEFVADSHDEFVHAIYRNISTGRANAITGQTLRFKSKQCFSVSFQTDLADEVGRPGLFLSVGIVMNRGFHNSFYQSVETYLRVLFNTLNREFDTCLPETGASALLNILREPPEGIDERLQRSADALLAASASIGDVARMSWPWCRPMHPRRDGRPLTLVHGDDADIATVLGSFLHETRNSWPAEGIQLDGRNVAALEIPAGALLGVRRAELRRTGKSRYIVLSR